MYPWPRCFFTGPLQVREIKNYSTTINKTMRKKLINKEGHGKRGSISRGSLCPYSLLKTVGDGSSLALALLPS
jgi:hypothetical protein